MSGLKNIDEFHSNGCEIKRGVYKHDAICELCGNIYDVESIVISGVYPIALYGHVEIRSYINGILQMESWKCCPACQTLVKKRISDILNQKVEDKK